MQADTRMQRDFRARSRAWFMSCRNCGNDFNLPPQIKKLREAKGEHAPPKLCSGCVLARIYMLTSDEGE